MDDYDGDDYQNYNQRMGGDPQVCLGNRNENKSWFGLSSQQAGKYRLDQQDGD